MQTPFDILQIKQKQRKTLITRSQKQRSLGVKFQRKNGNYTELTMAKENSNQHQFTKKCKSQSENNSKNSVNRQKYQIIFRQSIRKVNEYRNNAYHTHSVLKNNNFMKNLQSNSQNLKNNKRKFKSLEIDQSPKSNSRLSKRQNIQTLNVGKYRILLKTSKQNNWLNDTVPQISVQKCKINSGQSDTNNQLQTAIKKLYNHNNSQKCQRSKTSSQEKIRNKIYSYKYNNNFQQTSNASIEVKQNYLISDSNQEKSNKIHFKKFPQNSSNQKRKNFLQRQGQTLDEVKVANFIKSKRNKRVPLCIKGSNRSRESSTGSPHFRRAITDQFQCNKTNRHDTLSNRIRQTSFPNKRKNVVSKIKFNSIEDNISGWDQQPSARQYLP